MGRKLHIPRSSDPETGLCGQVYWQHDGTPCLRCLDYAAKRPASGFQVQGRRGGEWVDVPAAWYGPDYRQMAVDRANVLADMVNDSEFRVVDLARGTVVYHRAISPVPSPVGWPGNMVSGRADYAREPKRYRRKGTRRDRRQCRGGWRGVEV